MPTAWQRMQRVARGGVLALGLLVGVPAVAAAAPGDAREPEAQAIPAVHATAVSCSTLVATAIHPGHARSGFSGGERERSSDDSGVARRGDDGVCEQVGQAGDPTVPCTAARLPVETGVELGGCRRGLRSTQARTRSCGSVRRPYPGTRYEDVDLTRITADGVTCRTARRVARGAHRKALGLTPSDDGVLRLTWDGWRVTGDLRGASDRYTATKRGARVRWTF